MKKYWYFFTHYVCPYCDKKPVTYRIRMYSEKPDDYNLRHEWIQEYDYCDQ